MADAATLHAFNAKASGKSFAREVEDAVVSALHEDMAEEEAWGDLGDTPWSDLDLEGDDNEDDEDDLSGLGSFLRKIHNAIRKVALAPVKWVSPKLAQNLEKVDNKVLDTAEKIKDKVVHFLKKNWKWVAVVIAIAITIYTMGAGATIMAHMISGMQALGSYVGIGAGASTAGAGAAAGASGAAIGGAAATGAGAAAAAGTAAATTSTGILGLSAHTWVSLAMTGAKLLSSGKKVTDLSSQQAQAMMTAQQHGVDLIHPELAPYLQQRALLGGGPIATDAYGRPLTGPDGKPIEQSVVEGMDSQTLQAYGIAQQNAQASLGPSYGTGAAPPGSMTPVLLGAGAAALLFALA